MFRQPQVSVIVPAHNAAHTLRECLDSLLAQTLQGLEIIVVDDGSEDETPALLQDYVKRVVSPNSLRVLRQSNRGVSAARNAGLAAATGDFVAFVDADDIASPDLYSTLLQRARRDALDVTLCNAWNHGLDGVRSLIFPATISEDWTDGPAWLVQAMAGHYLRHYIWCHLYRRSFLQNKGFQFAVGISHQDIVWTNQVLLYAQRVGMVNRPLYHYLQRPGSLSRPQSSVGRLAAARHYMRVANLLEELARRCPEGAATGALRRQVVDEGIVVFHLSRHLSAAHRRTLYAEIQQKDFTNLLARNAATQPEMRRIWKRSLRFRIWRYAQHLRTGLRDRLRGALSIVLRPSAHDVARADIFSELGGK